jgi:hypothetical protein
MTAQGFYFTNAVRRVLADASEEITGDGSVEVET